MRSTFWRAFLLASASGLAGPLIQGTAEGGVVLRRPSRPPSQVVAIKPLRLEVQISAAGMAGDIVVYERWGPELLLEARRVVHFRFEQAIGTVPSEVWYMVYSRPLPSEPGELVERGGSTLMQAVRARGARRQSPDGGRTTAAIRSHLVPVASGSLGAPPGRGKTREFDIDFTAFLPASPDGKQYHVALAGLAPQGDGTSVWCSTTVKITYSHQPITEFPDPPTLKRVVGTRDALGHELTLSGDPLAVITGVFRLEGSDFCYYEHPFDATVQFLRDGKIVKEVHPVRELSQKLPSGETSLAVRPPLDLSDGPWYVRVQSGWGASAERRIRVGGRRPPDVGRWQLLSGGVYENHDWTEECQGITTDGNYWYISSNNDGDRALYKFTIGMQLVARHDMEQYGSDEDYHVSDLDCFDNKLYVALEVPKRLLVIGTDFSNAKLYQLHGSRIGDPDPLRGSFAWCAVHPLTGDICTTSFSYANMLYRYRKENEGNYVCLGSVPLSRGIRRVQGGDITPAGKLLLVSDAEPFGIYVYNVFTGQYYGAVTFGVSPDYPDLEELEGLTISPPGTVAVKGGPANVHLVLLDNDVSNEDDVYFKHVRVPSLDDLFGF